MMRVSVAGIAVALVAGLLVTAAPTAANIQSTQAMSGVIERIIVEPIAHDDDHDSHADEGLESEQVYLMGDDGTQARIPLALAGDLETGTRVRMRVAPSSEGMVAASIPDVVSRPSPRSGGAPRPTTQQLPYAVVTLNTPDTDPGGATAADVRAWMAAADAFYYGEAPEAFRFSVVAEYETDWETSVCRVAGPTVQGVRQKLGIADDIGIILLTYDSAMSCGYSGLALLNSGRPGGWMILNSRPGRNPTLLIHELGHNLGLSHATRWRCTTGNSPLSPGASGCVKQEYGVRGNVMGGGPVWPDLYYSPIDPFQRWQLGVYGGTSLLSVTAGSGAALLLDHVKPLFGADTGNPLTHAGERVVRALHLRDSLGEAWVVARESVFTSGTDGATVAYRADWGQAGSKEPMQLDTVQAAPDEQRESSSPAAYDLVTAGGTVRTPGGTVITVVGDVDAGPFGTALLVTWQGSAPSMASPSAPGVISTASGQEVAGGWIAPTGSSAVLRGIPSEAEDCEVIDGEGASLARWRASNLVPVPGPEWRGALDATKRYLAWSPDAGQSMLASWRFPLAGGAPQDGASSPITVTGSTASLRTRCTDFAGTTAQSPAVSLRVDSTPPRVADGTLAIQGLSSGQVEVTSGIRSARPYLLLSMPSFVDSESGLGKRVEACTYLSPEKSTSCYSTVSVGKGTVRSAAVDAVGNRSATQEVPYRLVPIRTVTKPSASWIPTEQGHRPAASGASTTVKVRGRQMGVVTRCGSGLGTMRIDVNGRKGAPFDVASRFDPFYCLVGITNLTKRVNRVTISYLEPGTTDHELVGVIARK